LLIFNQSSEFNYISHTPTEESKAIQKYTATCWHKQEKMNLHIEIRNNDNVEQIKIILKTKDLAGGKTKRQN